MKTEEMQRINMQKSGIKQINQKKTGIDRTEAIIWYICVFFIVLGALFHITKHLYLDENMIPAAIKQVYYQSEGIDWAQTVMSLVTLSIFIFITRLSKNMENKVPAFIRLLVIAFAIIAMVIAIFNSTWDIFANSMLAIVLLLLTFVLPSQGKVYFPPEFMIFIYLFIFASMFCGEVLHFYYLFSVWDIIVHFISTPFLGYAGFLMVYTKNKDVNIHNKLSPFFIALYAFCFSMMICVAWEFFEYGVDVILGSNMQKARNLELVYGYFDTRLGVLDTMEDLIVDALGSLLVSAFGYYSLTSFSNRTNNFFHMRDVFIEENPALFQ
jgi:hypothetical protein